MYHKEAIFLSKLNDVKRLIEERKPKTEIAKFLNIKYDTLNNYFKKYGIEYKGNPNREGIPHYESRIPLDDILSNKIPYRAFALRKRLFEDGLKEKKCECCGITDWNGKEICFELHHIDGDELNNNLDNLQILCPNCHSQTDNYRNRNSKKENSKLKFTKFNEEIVNEIKKIASSKDKTTKKVKAKKTVVKKEKTKRYCECCGAELDRQLKYCSVECAHNAVSKRPAVLELIDVLEKYNHNITAVGKHYGVSDNAIRKWMTVYKL